MRPCNTIIGAVVFVVASTAQAQPLENITEVQAPQAEPTATLGVKSLLEYQNPIVTPASRDWLQVIARQEQELGYWEAEARRLSLVQEAIGSMDAIRQLIEPAAGGTNALLDATVLPPQLTGMSPMLPELEPELEKPKTMPKPVEPIIHLLEVFGEKVRLTVAGRPRVVRDGDRIGKYEVAIGSNGAVALVSGNVRKVLYHGS